MTTVDPLRDGPCYGAGDLLEHIPMFGMPPTPSVAADSIPPEHPLPRSYDSLLASDWNPIMHIFIPPAEQAVQVDNLSLSLSSLTSEPITTLCDKTLSPFNKFIVGLHIPDIHINTHLLLIMEHEDNDSRSRQSLDYDNNNDLKEEVPSWVNGECNENYNLIRKNLLF